jgi:hypothetical protein
MTQPLTTADEGMLATVDLARTAEELIANCARAIMQAYARSCAIGIPAIPQPC